MRQPWPGTGTSAGTGTSSQQPAAPLTVPSTLFRPDPGSTGQRALHPPVAAPMAGLVRAFSCSGHPMATGPWRGYRRGTRSSGAEQQLMAPRKASLQVPAQVPAQAPYPDSAGCLFRASKCPSGLSTSHWRTPIATLSACQPCLPLAHRCLSEQLRIWASAATVVATLVPTVPQAQLMLLVVWTRWRALSKGPVPRPRGECHASTCTCSSSCCDSAYGTCIALPCMHRIASHTSQRSHEAKPASCMCPVCTSASRSKRD